MTFAKRRYRRLWKQFLHTANPLSLHLFHFHPPGLYSFTLSQWKTTLSPTHTLTLLHGTRLQPLPSLAIGFFLFFIVNFRCGSVWSGAGCEGFGERGGVRLCAHSRCLMNEGCLWLLGEESSFNMSLESGPARLYWSRVGRCVRDGVWQEETVGHRKEWWPWKTQIHRLPPGNAEPSISRACERRAHMRAAVMDACISAGASTSARRSLLLCARTNI